MSILYLGQVIFSSVEEQIEWFQRHSLLATHCNFVNARHTMHVDIEMQAKE